MRPVQRPKLIGMYLVISWWAGEEEPPLLFCDYEAAAMRAEIRRPTVLNATFREGIFSYKTTSGATKTLSPADVRELDLQHWRERRSPEDSAVVPATE